MNIGILSALTANLGAINAGTITGVTITGGTVRTASSGERVQLSSSLVDKVEWFDSGGLSRCDIQRVDGSQFFVLKNSQSSVQIVAGGIDQYLFSTTAFQIASGNILDMNNGDIGSCGDIELDSITKDGAGNILLKSNLVPDIDDTHTLGTSTGPLRWADVRSVLINGADIGFESDWKFREWPCTKEQVHNKPDWFKEHAREGIQLVDDDEKTQVVLHKNGNVYIRGSVLPMEELPQ